MSTKCRMTAGAVEFSDGSGNFGSGSRFGRFVGTSAGLISFVGQTDGDKATIAGMQTGTGSDSLATKQYVDAATAKLHMYPSVDYATGSTVNDAGSSDIAVDVNAEPSTITTSGSGINFNTLFNASNGMASGTVTVEEGMRFLIKDTISGGGNLDITGATKKLAGIWYASSVTSQTVWTLTRAPDMSSGGKLHEGGYVIVNRGAQASQMWMIGTDFLRYAQPNGSGAFLECSGTVGSTTLTIRRSSSNYTLAAPQAESLSYTETTYRNEDGSNVTYIRAGQGIQAGDYYYTVSADSTAAATITLTTPLQLTLSDARLRFGLMLKGSDADDDNSSVSYMSNDATHYLGFSQFGAGTSYSGGTNITLTGSTFNLDAALNNMTSVTGATTLTLATNGNNDMILNAGTGNVSVGNNSATGTIESRGDNDLVLQTGNATTGSMTITDGANGDITIAPNGTGALVVGSGSANAPIESNGDHNLIMRTGNATTGTMTIVDGANGNFELFPNGTGNVVVGGSAPTVQSIAGSALTLSSATTNHVVLQTNDGGADTSKITVTHAGNITLAPAGSSTVACSSKRITGVADPTGAQDAATKLYVDQNPAKPSARVATTAALADLGGGSWTYNSGAGTLTAAGVGVHPTIDGITLVANDYVLIQDGFATAVTNGVGTSDQGCQGLYEVTTLGAGGATHVYTRVDHMNATADFSGAKVYVEEGTTNGGKTFVCDVTPNAASNPFVLNSGTAAAATLNFSEFGGSSSVDLNGLDAATVNVAADSIAIIDADDSNTSKKESIADLVSGIASLGLSASSGTLSVGGFSNNDDITDTNGNDWLRAGVVSSAVNRLKIFNAATGDSVDIEATGSDSNIDLSLLPKGTGVVTLGTGAATGTLQSEGNFDLTLQTGNATTGSITITDGANGDITVAPNGTGAMVVGSGSTNGAIESNGNHNLIMRTGNATTGTMTIVDGANGNFELFPNGTGNVVVGGSAPTVQSIAGSALTLSSATPANVVMQTNDGGANTSTVTVTHNGDVVVAPATSIMSVGTGAAAGVVESNGDFDLTLQTGNSTTGTITITDGANGDITLAPNGTGNVAVGSGSAAGVLESNGDQDLTLQTGNSTTGSITITDGANGNIEVAPNGTGDVLLTTDQVRLGSSGENVTITTFGTGDLTLNTNNGTNSGSIAIADGANGNITFTLNGTGIGDFGSASCEADEFVSTSDLRLKKYVESIQDALAKVMQLDGFIFDWKHTGNRSVGVGAQHVQAVLPEAVHESKSKQIEDFVKLKLNINGVVALLVNAIKELNTLIEQRHKKQEEINAELKSEIAELKKMLKTHVHNKKTGNCQCDNCKCDGCEC